MLVQDTLFSDFLEILLQGVECQQGFCLVDTSEVLAHKLLGRRRALVVVGGAFPLDGYVVVEDSPVPHRWCALYLAVVEPVAREAHDLVVHAVLYLQQVDLVGVVLHDALHEGLAQSCLQGGNTLHGGRQLAVVAGKHHARHLADGYPAGCLQGLGGLIYK